MGLRFDALLLDDSDCELTPELVLEAVRANDPQRRPLTPEEQNRHWHQRGQWFRQRRGRTSPAAIRDWLHGYLTRTDVTALRWMEHVLVLAHAGTHRTALAAVAALYSDALIAQYHDVDDPADAFRTAVFGDYGGEGRVCWDVARGADSAVLVGCRFESHGGWWRQATARAEVVDFKVDRTGKHYAARAVYRVSDSGVLADLWSRASHNDGIAEFVAPDTADVPALMAADWYALGDARTQRRLAENCGWLYLQNYGGGADEHWAVFAAADARLTRRVYEYAAERSQHATGWWLSGLF